MYILCPKCGRVGSLNDRWVRSSFSPRRRSHLKEILEELDKKLTKQPENISMTGAANRIKELLSIKKLNKTMIEQFTKEYPNFKAKSGIYLHLYVGHYDKSAYRKQMKNYRDGHRKARANGRIWCKLPKTYYPFFIYQKIK